MLEDRIVSNLLDRAWRHFELYESRRSSLTVLRVAVECNARDLRAFDRDVAAKMSDIVARLDAIEREPHTAWREVYKLKRELGELRDRQHKAAGDRVVRPVAAPNAEARVAGATAGAPEPAGDADLEVAEAEVDALNEGPIVSHEDLREVLSDGGEGRPRHL